MKIIVYTPKYRDDLIFMVLAAKDALGRVPTLNGDLLDLDGAYFSKGDCFWIMLDERDRVVGRTVMKLHLGEKNSYFESRYFYPKHGYVEYRPDYMRKTL